MTGIGSQRKALERLGIPHKVIGISEIDKYAIKSYEAMFGETRNYGDISVIDKLDYADFWTYSFPCTDLSVSGKLAGMIRGKTRSGLLYEVERLLNEAKLHNELPKYLMLENVKNLVGKKFKTQFDEWLEYLDELGYKNYWQVLNSKDYGIPQNRERVFVISIRKDIDNGKFEFPDTFDSGVRLKDILETEVDESFYIAQEKVEKMLSQIKDKNTLLFDVCQAKREDYFRDDFSPTLTARDYKNPRLVNQSVNIIGKLSSSQDGVVVSQNGIAPTHTAGHGNCPKIVENRVRQIGNYIEEKKFDNPQCGRVYSAEGCSPTLNTMQGGDRQPKILQTPRGLNKEGLHQVSTTLSSHSWECDNFINEPCIAASRGRNPDNPSDRTTGSPTEQRLEINKKGICNTITSVQKDCLVVEPKMLCSTGQCDDEGNRSVTYSLSDAYPTISAAQYKSDGDQPKACESIEIDLEFRIRKLTPLECWRLMGFDDEDFNKAKYESKERSEEILRKHPKHKGRRIMEHGERIERMSNSQLYKQAGNSIVVDVLYHIFKNVFSHYIIVKDEIIENFIQPPIASSSLAV